MAHVTDQESVSGAYETGMDLYRQGRYSESLAHLERVEPQDDLLGALSSFYAGMCHRALGLERLGQGEFPQAQGHLHEAQRRLGDSVELTSYLAHVYARTGRFDECASQLERRTKTDPSAEPLRHLAQVQWHQGRREQAYMTLTCALRQHEGQADLSIQLALFHAAEEQYDRARALLESVVRADSARADAHRYLGLCAGAMGDPLAATRALQRAFELRPGDLMTARQLAIAARAAAEAGQRVVLRLCDPAAVAPQNTEIQQLAEYVTRESDFLDAFCALPPSPVDPDLFEMLLGVLQVALASHRDYADLHYYQARIADRLGRAHQVHKHLNEALRINPRYVSALLMRARLEAEAGQTDRAVLSARQAVACGADWPDVHCQLGEWMIRCRQADQARDHLTRALQLRQGYPRALRALRSLAA